MLKGFQVHINECYHSPVHVGTDEQVAQAIARAIQHTLTGLGVTGARVSITVQDDGSNVLELKPPIVERGILLVKK